MKKSLFFACLCGIIIGLSSCEREQKSSIYGIVTDYETREPLKNAMIVLFPSSQTTLTGTDGYYKFENLDALSSYSLEAQANGYKRDRRMVQLTSGKTIEVSFALRKE